jgi:hypothetical protein
LILKNFLPALLTMLYSKQNEKIAEEFSQKLEVSHDMPLFCISRHGAILGFSCSTVFPLDDSRRLED